MASYGKSTGKSVAIVFLVVLLAAAIFFGVVTEGFTNWDASTWFGKDQEQGTVVDGDGNEMEDGGSYQLPKAMVYTAGARRSRNERAGDGGIGACGRDESESNLGDRVCRSR